MLASLLSPSTPQPDPLATGRISQLLPTVKCSTCHRPVPLAELGEHTCSAPPPVPTLPKPSVTPAAATNLLPERLQGRVAQSITSTPVASGSGLAASPPKFQPSPREQHQRLGSSVSSRLRINTNGPNSPTGSSFQPKPSPLSQPDPVRQQTKPPMPRDPFPVNSASSPAQTRGPPGADFRARTTSSPGSNYPTPSTARPNVSFKGEAPSPQMGPPTPRIGPPLPNSPAPRGPIPINNPNLPRNGTPRPMNGTPPNRNGPPPPGFPGPGSAMSYPPRPGIVPPPRNTGPPGGMNPPGTMGPPMNMGAPRNIGPPPTMNSGVPMLGEAFVPPTERGINTKTGGAAGMAGVGRRGFAAAARAAMFVGPVGPQPLYNNRRPNAPRFLDIDAASRPTETPPLSAGSGYSSHSPGPTSPAAQADFVPQPMQPRMPMPRTPSPSGPIPVQPTIPSSTPIPNIPAAAAPASPRLPFFEKLKNKIPGSGSVPEPMPPTNNQDTDAFSNFSSNIASTMTRPRNNTTTSAGSISLARSTSSNTSASRGEKAPLSPRDSESEYSGLAYADSTDYEDNSGDISATARPAQTLATLHLRSGSTSSSTSKRSGIRVAGPRSSHIRDHSASSYSSTSSTGSGVHATRSRKDSNSSAIAQALGLSQTPPSDYSKLGGPGVPAMGKRVGRSNSGSSSTSASQSAYSSVGLEHTMQTLLEGVAAATTSDSKVATGSGLMLSKSQRSISSNSSLGLRRRADTTSSTSSRDDRAARLLNGTGAKTQRSNTVQVPRSPESIKPVKLPMRSLTSPRLDGDKSADTPRPKKDRTRKPKVCLKCQKTIEDGRWVSVDNGGVLCEKCWKNMYLPKCRRCNLSIEKQAVSSSDGQLKGKYHKECFNCHKCHKTFPDKTFYVYDGKPLCAYHYHEANDSLCAAALCGQPIEGPCAVSHSGDRYHPEHMTCEYPGYPKCKERLEEYWEVDGRMLCEGHATHANRDSGDEDDGRWVQSSKAMKRVTRFIDLANNNTTAGAGRGDEDNLL